MTDNRTTELLRKLLDERGLSCQTHYLHVSWRVGSKLYDAVDNLDGTLTVDNLTPEQAVAATLGRPKAKAHPYGYEPDTGAFDCTRCECGCINDISATYCNDCGGEIEIDMYAEKEIYHIPCHLVFAEKHDDGSLEFGGKRYVAATLGSGTLTAAQVRECVEKHWHDLSDEYDMPEATALPEYSYDWQAIADELNSRADYHGYEQAAIEACESIKAWNSRAERTCEFNIKDNMNETEGMGDVWIECSACNCVFDFYADEWLMKMSYCPNCGARRVGE